MKAGALVFLFFFGAIQPGPSFAEEAKVPCTDCKPDSKLQTQAEKVKDLAVNSSPECKKESLLFDPQAKSFLDNVGFEYHGGDPTVVQGRCFATCFWGLGYGIYGSIRDLIKTVPDIGKMTWRGFKAARETISSAEFSGWLKSVSPQKIWDKAGRAFAVTRDSIHHALSSASESAYEGYREGGVTGSLAAVAQSAYASSPRQTFAKYLTQMGEEIYNAIGREWTGFACMTSEARSQMMCNVAAYLATDIFTGKLMLSGMMKGTAKLGEAVKWARAKMIRQTAAAERVVKDSEVAESGGKSAAAGAVESDPYSPPSTGPAEDFVQQASEASATPVSKTEAKELGAALATDRAQMESYGNLLRSVQSLRDRMKLFDPSSVEGKAVAESVKQAEKSIAQLNETLERLGSAKNFNMDLIQKALDESIADPSSTPLKTVTRALEDFNKTASRYKNRNAAIAAWEDRLQTEKPFLSRESIDRASQCLFDASSALR